MKKLLLLLSIVAMRQIHGQTVDYWKLRDSIGGAGREDALCFSIDSIGKGYVGCGNGTNDFWEFDPSVNTWTQKGNYPGASQVALISFTIGGRAYAGGGGFAKDFWEYNPVTDIWIQKANLPMGVRWFSFSFSIGKKGYFGGGWDTSTTNYHADFWEYNPNTDTWTQKANFGGGPNARGIGISTSTKGYACMGYPNFNSDFWEYDPGSDTWTQRASVGGPMHADVVGFSICDKVYITTGETLGAADWTNELWCYDPTTNSWTQKANFMGDARDEAVGFSLLGKGYAGTGGYGRSDWYEYTPDSCSNEVGIEKNILEQDISIYPNPTSDQFVILTNTTDKLTVDLFDINGRCVFTANVSAKENINVSTLDNGAYTLTIKTADRVINKKLVILR